MQPIFVDDFAVLAVERGGEKIVEAIEPETFEYREMVETMSEIVLGKRRLILPIPDWFGLLVGKLIDMMTGDVVIAKAEIDGLKANLLYVDARLSDQLG